MTDNKLRSNLHGSIQDFKNYIRSLCGDMERFGINGMVSSTSGKGTSTHTILWRDCKLRGMKNGKSNSNQVKKVSTYSVKSHKMSADVGKAVKAR